MSWTTPRTWVTGEVLSKTNLDTHVRDNLNYLKTNIALEAAVELTISSGAVTKTYSHHTIDTESDAASDDLVTINGGSEGEVILLRPASGARTVIVKHNTGNIWLPGGADISLDDSDDYLLLIYSGSKWSGIGGTGLSHTQGTDTTLGTQAEDLDMGGYDVDNVDSIKTGNSPKDLTVSCGTEKTLVLSNVVYDDLLVPVTSIKAAGVHDPGFTKFLDDGAGSQGIYLYWFDAATEEELFFVAQFPHTMKLNTSIYPHVHWTPLVTADGSPANQKVVWGLEYAWADIGQSFPVNSAIISASTHAPNDANVVAGKHYLTSLPAIAASASRNQGVSSILICRVFRMAADGADNYEHDAGMLAIDFHHEIDTMGSRSETAK